MKRSLVFLELLDVCGLRMDMTEDREEFQGRVRVLSALSVAGGVLFLLIGLVFGSSVKDHISYLPISLQSVGILITGLVLFVSGKNSLER